MTYNLDIRQFAQDIITNADGPELLRAIWQAVRDITILDPTCGSGAFSSLPSPCSNPCMKGASTRSGLLDEAKRLGDNKRLARLSEFQTTLDSIAKHTNESYFVLKSIIVNNLYGVDIMEEAVEICRLRLFLKLVAQVDRADQIEPLPDIDFNIRPGNTLVGYATKAQSQDNLNFGGAIERIDKKAAVFDTLFQKFKEQQLTVRSTASSEDIRQAFKSDLLKPLTSFAMNSTLCWPLRTDRWGRICSQRSAGPISLSIGGWSFMASCVMVGSMLSSETHRIWT